MNPNWLSNWRQPPTETADEHFRRCGPFCSHVTWCRECINVFGFCNRPGCDGKAKWVDQVEHADNPAIELGAE